VSAKLYKQPFKQKTSVTDNGDYAMSKLTVALLVFIIIGGLATVNSTQAQSSTKISGYILDSNGNPISGAYFTLLDAGRCASNGLGYFEVYAVPGTYHIFLYPPFDSRYIDYEEQGFVVGSSDVNKNVTLDTGCKVTGYIFDTLGHPVQGGIVVMNGNLLSGWSSTASGYYFVNVPAGTYSIWLHPVFGTSSAPNFPDYHESYFAVNSDTTKNITVAVTSKISGYVLDSSGRGLSGAEIIFNVPSIVPSVITNAAGFYQISAPMGTYHVNVWPPFDSNYIDYDEPGFSVATSTILKNITLTSGQKLSGYLTDYAGAPIRGAGIWLSSYATGWYSNDAGYYFVTAPAGTYTLTIQPRTGPAFPTHTESNFTLTSNITRNFTLTSPPNTPAPTPQPTQAYTPPPANPTSTPTPNPTPTLPSTFLTMSAQATNPEVGSSVNVNGRLSDQNANYLSNKTVVLSYTVSNVTSWSEIGSGKTNAAGEYSIQWLIPASGTFTLKTQWAGDQSYLGSSNSTTLSILPYQAQKVFFVESNSTVTGLTFNSSDLTLSFTVSGASGTKGYVKTTISKSMVQNFTGITVTLDGKELNATVSSTETCWVVTFNYSHSTHQVAITLTEDQTNAAPSASPTPTLAPAVTSTPKHAGSGVPMWIYAAAAIAIIAVLSATVLLKVRRKKA
jgi:hypothetical protein